MGFGTDETDDTGLDENGIAGEDESSNPILIVEDSVVNSVISEVSISKTIITGVIKINIEVLY